MSENYAKNAVGSRHLPSYGPSTAAGEMASPSPTGLLVSMKLQAMPRGAIHEPVTGERRITRAIKSMLKAWWHLQPCPGPRCNNACRVFALLCVGNAPSAVSV